MKILKTFGENAKATEDVIRQLEARGATNTAKVDSTVREILAVVREHGDAALREYAARFDGLAEDQSLLVSRAGLGLHTTMRSTPATCAGVAVISSVEGRG